MSSEILQILKGIDQTQTESEEGWWETSEGARFGAQKLEAVISRFKKLESQRNELLEALETIIADDRAAIDHDDYVFAKQAIAKAKGE